MILKFGTNCFLVYRDNSSSVMSDTFFSIIDRSNYAGTIECIRKNDGKLSVYFTNTSKGIWLQSGKNVILRAKKGIS